MTDKEAMAKELEELAGRFSEGWHEGIKIDASDIMLLSQAAEALAQPEQEPVAHLWECLGRWSAYLVNNGTQAECAPPSWLVEAVKNATTPPQRTEQKKKKVWTFWDLSGGDIADAIKAKLKEKNA